MNILVTGASGRVGSAVARELLLHGHKVRVFDRSAPPKDLRRRVKVIYGDIADRYALMKAAEGMDAIAHLAAIPNPNNGNEEILFQPNVLGTQYLLAAAELHEVSRVVLASTCAIYGLPFARERIEPQYLPLDENHPMLQQDLYGLSKQINELTAATYTRRSGMATTCLRISMVVDFTSPQMRWLHRMIERAAEWPSHDLWAYIDVRDVARAFRLALERVESGHHVAHIVARDTLTDHDRRDLIRRHFPHLERFLETYNYEAMGFWDTRRAEELFGFVAEIDWRDEIKKLDDAK
jgi:nucleoside-diphosphate-sugar epimerase